MADLFQPNAELVSFTPHGEGLCAAAATICYDSQPEDYEKLLRACIRQGHLSILEHASATFLIECTRACSHQIVRHRIASYSQRSQRFVDESEKAAFYLPEGMPEKVRVLALESCGNALSHYRLLRAYGTRPEDARAVLPNAMRTVLYMTANYREWLHFLNLRLCNKAQEEMRTIAGQIRRQLMVEAPVIFEASGPDCFKGKCKQDKPCGIKSGIKWTEE